MSYQVIQTDRYVSVSYTGMFPERGVAEASLIDENKGFWYINRVVVSEACRGQGIGGKMLNMLIDMLKKTNAKKIVVDPGGYGSSIRRLNKFYRDHGFCKSSLKGRLEIVLHDE